MRPMRPEHDLERPKPVFDDQLFACIRARGPLQALRVTQQHPERERNRLVHEPPCPSTRGPTPPITATRRGGSD